MQRVPIHHFPHRKRRFASAIPQSQLLAELADSLRKFIALICKVRLSLSPPFRATMRSPFSTFSPASPFSSPNHRSPGLVPSSTREPYLFSSSLFLSLDDRLQAELAWLRSLASIADPLAASDSVIPNDLLLTSFTPHQLVLGPNCSGKTTFIKQIGVACVLAQIGCFVPAQYAHLPVFESLAMCGGEEESIESGLSSFAREVRCVRDVLETLSGNSLLLCDEFGKRWQRGGAGT